jgi:hypothetical protein
MKFIILIGLTLGLIACGSSRKIEKETPVDPRPEWVKERPIIPGEYTGIGMSNKSYGADFRESARKNSLADMSSQIEVQISVNSLLYTLSSDTKYQQDFRSLNKTTTNLQLEGYELVGTWENDSEYWMYYRLPISIYQEQRRKKIQAAREQGLDLLKKGDEISRSGAVPAAVGYYIKALEQLKPFANEAIQADYEGKTIYLGNEILKSLNESLRNLTFTVTPAEVSLMTAQKIDQEISIEVRLNSGGFPPVSGLPLSVGFTKGGGNLTGTPITDPEGKCKIRLTELKSFESAQEIMVRPDVEKLIVTQPAYKQWQNLVDSRQLSSRSILLKVVTPMVFVKASETNLEQPLTVPRMSRFIQQELGKQGVRFTEDISAADYVLSVTAQTKTLGEFNGMYSTALNAEIRLTDPRTQQDMGTVIIPEVRGVQLTYPRAGEDAYFKAESEIRRRVIPILTKGLLGK